MKNKAWKKIIALFSVVVCLITVIAIPVSAVSPSVTSWQDYVYSKNLAGGTDDFALEVADTFASDKGYDGLYMYYKTTFSREDLIGKTVSHLAYSGLYGYQNSNISGLPTGQLRFANSEGTALMVVILEAEGNFYGYSSVGINSNNCVFRNTGYSDGSAVSSQFFFVATGQEVYGESVDSAVFRDDLYEMRLVTLFGYDSYGKENRIISDFSCRLYNMEMGGITTFTDFKVHMYYYYFGLLDQAVSTDIQTVGGLSLLDGMYGGKGKFYFPNYYIDGYGLGNDEGFDEGYAAGTIYVEDVREGSYANGYYDGTQDGDKAGYDRGYDEGKAEGWRLGEAHGITETGETLNIVKEVIFSIFDAPAVLIDGLLDFDLFGIDFSSLVKAIITMAFVAAVVFILFKFGKG